MAFDELAEREKSGLIRPTFVDATLVPERKGSVSMMSQTVRNGRWAMPRLFRAVTIMGNIELDLTQALIGPGVSKIEMVAIMSNVTVVVPPWVRIECDGDPFMGSFEVQRFAQTTAGADAPVIDISGTAIMSSINAVVVDPNITTTEDKAFKRWLRGRKSRG